MKPKISLPVIILLLIFSTTILNSQTATWNGSIDSNWNNASNWDEGVVPDKDYDIIIPENYTNKLTVTNVQSAKSITINANADLNISFSGSISVLYNVDIYGSLADNNRPRLRERIYCVGKNRHTAICKFLG